MTATTTSLLILLFLLQIKHMFADFFWQTPRMLADRGRYLHMGRAQHAGLHALSSALALLVVGVSVPVLVAIVLAEWVAHYHIDWAKGHWSDRSGHTPAEGAYWRAVGVDQALHQLTYLAMVWAWVAYA
ncbi:DUF3307 domain-containing protein [Pseudosulfitobacter koreensis]|uniref:DUF3307 domain-containing protein n=1 Tax=Pseudosulfitobacter koreensis TaxID=2968472 RepID=A0ABT1YZR4_9RHOB|nr:DUF3307 domain-containing protein [Pseudosulfitobacter koreense]MCR8826326.1 DUF3307 domain-containing protein [Pseudosulfitobacter koreense]